MGWKAKSSAKGHAVPTTKDYVQFYFGKKTVEGPVNVWKCACGIQRKCNVNISGYTNLIGHVKDRHPDYVQVYEDAHSDAGDDGAPGAAASSLDNMFDSEATNIFKWIE
jgi:hypothetical protein